VSRSLPLNALTGFDDMLPPLKAELSKPPERAGKPDRTQRYRNWRRDKRRGLTGYGKGKFK
jgi:hypothetical protein